VKAQRLAKLQVLLERVQSRSSTPRDTAAFRDGVSAPAAPALAPPLRVAPVVVQEASYVDDDSVDLPTWPPPPAPSNPPVVTGFAASEPEPDISIDVEISESPPAVEVEIAAVAESVVAEERVAGDEPASMGSESVERLVVAPAVALEPAVEVTVSATAESNAVFAHDDVELAASASADRGETAAMVLEAPSMLSEPEVPRAPASSRRPVALTSDIALADMAFDADEVRPPRHTPPPESGRLPASPVEEFDPDVTGVRSAPQPQDAKDAEVDGQELAVGAAPVALHFAQLAPQVTRAELTSSGEGVDAVVGELNAFAPATFGDWLDAALAL
jgi:hypothetical protein